MNTGFYQFNSDFIRFLQCSPRQQALARKKTKRFTALEGKVVAKVMALLIEHGFQAFATFNALFKRKSFFEENFLILDDDAKESLYQGKFLIRTMQPDDQMNVWFGFLQSRGILWPLIKCFKYLKNITGGRIDFYSILRSANLVSTRTLSEAQADQYENDPERVDLVLRFKDMATIYRLLQAGDLDMVDLMFQNQLQINGNQNHLYKLGAITRNLQLALGK
jgi:hypothetical protein